MKSFKEILLVLSCFLVLMVDVQASGFHSDEFLIKVAVNLDYPDGLHVEGKVWKAQQQGDLPLPDMKRLSSQGEERRVLNEILFKQIVDALESFGELLETKDVNEGYSSITVLLVDEMMWNIFASNKGETTLYSDMPGSGTGELVIITESTVMLEIAKKSLSIDQAMKMGIMRM